MGGVEINFEYIGHLAYTLGILSFVLKDIFWLRVITILSATLCIVFNYASPAEPMWVPIYWNAALIAVNVVQIIVLAREQRAVIIDEREKWLYLNVFPNFTPSDFNRLMATAIRKRTNPGETLIFEGQENKDLILITDGTCVVDLLAGTKPELQRGDFIGEMSFLTGKVASASVYALDNVEYVAWEQKKLLELLERNLPLQSAMRSAISLQLTEKIDRMGRCL